MTFFVEFINQILSSTLNPSSYFVSVSLIYGRRLGPVTWKLVIKVPASINSLDVIFS